MKAPEAKNERHFNINCQEDTANQTTKYCKESSSEGGEQEEKGLPRFGPKTHKKWTLKQWEDCGGVGHLTGAFLPSSIREKGSTVNK